MEKILQKSQIHQHISLLQMNFIKILKYLHCHISPPIFVVNDLVDAGVVPGVPGDDGHEDLLDDLLDKVVMGIKSFCNNNKS